MNRKTIIVDLDNCVYDFVLAFATWLDKNGALDRLRPPPDTTIPGTFRLEMSRVSNAMNLYSQWNIWDDWNIPKGEFMRWWRLGIEAEEIYANGPLIPGAREALWKLSDGEWSIYLATSRLTKFGAFDKIVANTAKWLNKNNIPYRDLAFTTQKTNMIADAIVDDRADNMSYKVHNKRFLFPAPHNKAEQEEYGLGVSQYCIDWPEIVEALL